MVDLETRALAMKQEYTLDRTSVHHRTPVLQQGGYHARLDFRTKRFLESYLDDL